MDASKPEFFKLVIDEASAIGAGQSLKAEKDAQQSVAGLKHTLYEVLRGNMDEYKISYLDNDGEKIRIEDDPDWATCIEELYSLPMPSFAKGLTIFIERLEGLANPLTASTVTSQATQQAVVKSTPDAAEPAPETVKAPSEETQTPAKDAQETTEEKKPASTHTSCFSNIPKPIEPHAPVYRFGYSPEELEWVKKVTPSVYSKIEEIFEGKIDSKLIESERAFKQYHQQQLKIRTAHLEKQIEDLKKQLKTQEQQIKNIKQQPLPFSNALVTNTIVTDPHLLNNYSPPQQVFSLPQPVTQPEKTDQGQKLKYCHLEIGCDECKQFPIRGLRYKALMKRDFDLCEECFLANKDTKEAYLVLRETEPQENNHLVQLARASQLASYEQRNKMMRRYHKWETEEEAELRRIEREADIFTELHYH